MKFNIARQPLIPAFLTLAALAAATVYRMDQDTTVAVFTNPANSALLPGELLLQLQNAYPTFSRILAGLLILFTGLSVGRTSTRHGLYSVNSCLAIPLYGIIACSIAPGGNYLAPYIASFLLALSIQHFSRACRSGYSFDAIFRASFYLGMLPFIYAPGLPLLLLLPLAILIFRRTLRESAVALTGLLLPALTICYVTWGFGYGFTEQLIQLGTAFAEGQPFQFIFETPLTALIFTSVILLLSIAAIVLYLLNSYASGSKPRFILTYNIGVLILTIALIFTPSANSGIVTLIAIPAALILPVLFIRINHIIATTIYLFLLVAALGYIFIL